MSANSRSPVIQRKRANILHLRKLFHGFKKLDHVSLTPQDMQRFGVKASRFDIRSDGPATSKTEPQFFVPMSSSKFASLPKEDFKRDPVTDPKWGGMAPGLGLDLDLDHCLNNEIPEELRLSDDQFSLMQYIKWHENGIREGMIYEGRAEFVTPESQFGTYEWRLQYLFDTLLNTEKYPHMMMTMVHNALVDESIKSTLLRGEVILIVTMLLWRMKLAVFAQDEQFPVLLISICRNQVRLIQGHFDGEQLHMAMSEFLDMSTFDKEIWSLLLRWVMNEPVGDTKVPTKTPLAHPAPSSTTTPAHRATPRKLAVR